VNLVDSCGWLEYLAAGPNAAFFAAPLTTADELLVPTICIYEVFRKVLAQRDEDAALTVAGAMQSGTIVDVNLETALLAARLAHGNRLSMADGIILAVARLHDAVIWTQNAHFEGMPGVRYVAASGKTRRRRKQPIRGTRF
jgi:predicted nucleic acid-binding protein